MPRQSQIDAPGDLHHVIIRGLERKTIFPQKGRVLRHVFRVGLNAGLENKDLLHIQVRETTGCSIVAVKRRDELFINPDPTIVLDREDELVLIGSAESEKLFNEKYPAAQ